MRSKANLAEGHGMSSSFFVQIFDSSVQKNKKMSRRFLPDNAMSFLNHQQIPTNRIPLSRPFRKMVLLHQERINAKGVYLI